MLTATARWLGQDGANPAGPGDVHVAISGLPVSPAIAAAVLSNSQRGVWIYGAKDNAPAAAALLRFAVYDQAARAIASRSTCFSRRIATRARAR